MIRIFCVILIIGIFLPVRLTFAHNVDQSGFFIINGTKAYESKLRSSVLDSQVPSHIAQTTFLIYKPITFSLNKTALPYHKEKLAKAQFVWDFGDGVNAEGESVTHTYSRIGSFMINVSARFENSSNLQKTNRLLIHITPMPKYQLPEAVIKINNQTLGHDENQSLPLDFTNKIGFDASFSKAPSSKIISYVWDFGDGIGSNDKNVDHTFGTSHFGSFVVLRVQDSNGFATYEGVELTNNKALVKKEVKKTSYQLKSVLPGLMILVVVLIFLYGIKKFIKKPS